MKLFDTVMLKREYSGSGGGAVLDEYVVLPAGTTGVIIDGEIGLRDTRTVEFVDKEGELVAIIDLHIDDIEKVDE